MLLVLHVSLLGKRQPRQTGSLLSSTRCFPEQETSLPFLSVFLLYKIILYLQETSSNPPPLCDPTANISNCIKYLKNRPHYEKWEVSSSYSLVIIWKNKTADFKGYIHTYAIREQVFSKVELDALWPNNENADVRQNLSSKDRILKRYFIQLLFKVDRLPHNRPVVLPLPSNSTTVITRDVYG